MFETWVAKNPKRFKFNSEAASVSNSASNNNKNKLSRIEQNVAHLTPLQVRNFTPSTTKTTRKIFGYIVPEYLVPGIDN